MTVPLGHSDWQKRILSNRADSSQRFADYTARVRKMAGPAHKGKQGWEGDYFDPINHTLAGVRLWASQLAYGTPRFKVGTSREQSRSTAQKGENALNWLTEQSNTRELNEILATDLWLDYSVTRTEQEPAPGFAEWENPFYWPDETRIAPWDFLYDEQAYELKRLRYMGDRGTRDVADVIREAEDDDTWDMEVLLSIQGRMIEHPPEVKDALATPMAEDRKQMRYWRIYCPEVTADDLREMGYDIPEKDENGRQYNAKGGYRGAEFTVLDPDDIKGEKFPRKPRMWWGPRGGPYTVVTGIVLPNDPLGVSPDTASKAQQQVANDVMRAVLQACEDGKTIALVASNAPDIVAACANAKNGDVVPIKDAQEIPNRVKELTLGFPTPELLLAQELTMGLLERASAMGPSQYGEVNSDTATANALAAQASQAVMGMLDVKFREFQAERGRKKLWYILKDERFVLVMPDEVLPETGDVVKPIHVGGNSMAKALAQAARVNPELPGQIEAQVSMATGKQQDFESILAAIAAEEEDDPGREANEDEIDRMQLSVDPLSMSRTAEGMQQARMQGQMESLPVMLQMAAQFPFWDWEDQFREWGDMVNMPGVERRLNLEKLAMYQQLTMGAAFAQPGGEQKPPEPRVAKDKGPTPFKPQQAQKPAGGGGAMGQGRSQGSMAGAGSKPKTSTVKR